jgi:hypothetical protein
MDSLEGQLASGLEALADAVIEWLRLVLQREQKKSDFKPAEDSMTEVINGPCTEVCSTYRTNSPGLQAMCRVPGKAASPVDRVLERQGCVTGNAPHHSESRKRAAPYWTAILQCSRRSFQKLNVQLSWCVRRSAAHAQVV